MRLLACLIVAPQRGYDEPAILSHAISSFCPTSADGLQAPVNAPNFRSEPQNDVLHSRASKNLKRVREGSVLASPGSAVLNTEHSDFLFSTFLVYINRL